jgi:hypothetical protein
MTSRHIYRLLIKNSLPRPASHTILYWETMKWIKAGKGELKSLSEIRYHCHFRRYKSYRLFLRLRQCKGSIRPKAGTRAPNNTLSLFAQKKRNPE